jgi:hypothetical protein
MKHMPIVATPSKDTIFTTGDPGEAIGEAAGKPTPSVATPIIATPPKDTIFAQMEKGTSMDTK